MRNLKNVFTQLIQAIVSYESVFILRWYVILSLTCVGMHILTTVFPSLFGFLWLSADRPWGVFTAVFLHSDAHHLSSNLFFFGVWSFLFIILNLAVTKNFYKFNAKLFVMVSLFSGFFTNLLDYMIRWYPQGVTTIGARGFSGVVFASAGVCVAFGIGLLCASVKALSEPCPWKIKLGRFGLGLVTAVGLTAAVISNPKAFLAVDSQVNVFAHKVAFLLGLCISATLILGYILLKNRIFPVQTLRH